MMTREQWLGRILATVDNIASREFQFRSWFGEGELVSSPDELYNALFDDLTFDLFFEKYSGDFTEAQKLAWRKLKERLELYARAAPEMMDPRAVFDDDRWQEVRDAASRFIEAFRNVEKVDT